MHMFGVCLICAHTLCFWSLMRGMWTCGHAQINLWCFVLGLVCLIWYEANTSPKAKHRSPPKRKSSFIARLINENILLASPRVNRPSPSWIRCSFITHHIQLPPGSGCSCPVVHGLPCSLTNSYQHIIYEVMHPLLMELPFVIGYSYHPEIAIRRLRRERRRINHMLIACHPHPRQCRAE